MRSLVQLVGVTCIAYALYNTWLMHGSLELSLMSGGLAQQPFLWLGVVLMVAPWVVGLFVLMLGHTHTRARAAALGPTGPSETYHRCRSCGHPVPSSAKVCRQCGEFQH